MGETFTIASATPTPRNKKYRSTSSNRFLLPPTDRYTSPGDLDLCDSGRIGWNTISLYAYTRSTVVRTHSLTIAVHLVSSRQIRADSLSRSVLLPQEKRKVVIGVRSLLRLIAVIAVFARSKHSQTERLHNDMNTSAFKLLSYLFTYSALLGAQSRELGLAPVRTEAFFFLALIGEISAFNNGKKLLEHSTCCVEDLGRDLSLLCTNNPCQAVADHCIGENAHIPGLTIATSHQQSQNYYLCQGIQITHYIPSGTAVMTAGPID
ncbi:hypothetical protein F5051DRAFT_489920 [Lentinula edodes]|nr:hypothetical protein F5051DRAFT_489920 [Lentinula edodes]